MKENNILENLASELKLEEKGFQLLKPIKNGQGFWGKQVKGATWIFNYDIIGYRVNSFGSQIFLSQVENILQPLLLKYGLLAQHELDEFTLWQYKIAPLQENLEPLRNRIYDDIRLGDQKGIEAAATLMSEIIEKNIMPFWEKYSQIQVVNDEIIDKVDQFKLSDYIYKWQSLKKMIIMKLCNNPKYDEYVEWHNGVLESMYAKDPEGFIQKYKLHQDLPKILEKL